MTRRRTRGGSGGAKNDSRFLTTYSDMMTLLLAFFILLFTMSTIDEQKFRELVDALRIPFDNQAAAENILDGADGITEGAANEGIDALDIFDDASPDDDVDDDEDVDEAVSDTPDDIADIRDQLLLAFDEAGIDTAADYRLDGRGLVISIGTDDVLFELGSADLTDQGREVLGVIAGALDESTNEIIVEGHTDDNPLRRQGETNWELSADRALAVLNLFWQEHDIDEQRMSAQAYGEYRPRVPNNTDANQALNRRVEIVVAPAGDIDERRQNLSDG